jgi:ketosteroid isomerase-like protein
VPVDTHQWLSNRFEQHRARQREVVRTFFAAAHGGDFEALVAVLDPDVVLRTDVGDRRRAASLVVRGAEAVARQALSGLASVLSRVDLRPALVSHAAGVLLTRCGRPFTVVGFTVTNGRIGEIAAISDPGRVARITAAWPVSAAWPVTAGGRPG